MSNALKLKSTDLARPLEDVFGTNQFVIYEVAVVHKYVDGNPTNEVDAIRYTVGDRRTCTKFDVKVNAKTPLLTQEAVNEALKKEKPIFIALTGSLAKPYAMEKGTFVCSARAESAALVQ